MKRTAILAIVFALSVSAMAATGNAETGIGFGVKGGGNLGNLFGDAVGNVEARLRMTGGAFVRFKMSEVFTIQPEVLYAQKGAEQTEALDFGNGTQFVTAYWEYDYIEIPILLSFTVPTEGGIAPSFYAGPTVSILQNAKIVGEGTEVDLKEFTKNTDFGLTIGGSIEFGGKGGAFLLDLRYVMGMNEFDDPPLSDLFLRKHNTIAFMAGFRIGA